MTNFEKITASAEALAEALDHHMCDCDECLAVGMCICGPGVACKEMLIDWLNQPAEGVREDG